MPPPFRCAEHPTGMVVISVDDKNFDRVVVSPVAVTFHWQPVNIGNPYQHALAQAIAAIGGIHTVDGSHQHHDMMHTDQADAAFPALHAHLFGDVDNDPLFKQRVIDIAFRLGQLGHLEPGECARIARGIQHYNDW